MKNLSTAAIIYDLNFVYAEFQSKLEISNRIRKVAGQRLETAEKKKLKKEKKSI
jgi:hypothetical protein